MATSARRYNYQPLTAESVKKRMNQREGLYDSVVKGVSTFRPVEGLNRVRFLPPFWENADHWALRVWIHRNVGVDNGSYLCINKMLNKPCPICEARAQLLRENDTEAGKMLAPKTSYVGYVIDRDHEEDGVKAWVYGWTVDEDIASRCIDRRTGAVLQVIDPDDGYDISFRRAGKGDRTKYLGVEVDRDPSYLSKFEDEQDKWLGFAEDNPIPKVLNFFDYEYLEKMISGGVTPRSTEEGDRGGDRGGGRDRDRDGDRGRGRERGDRDERSRYSEDTERGASRERPRERDEPRQERGAERSGRSRLSEEIDDHIPEQGAERERGRPAPADDPPPFEGGRERSRGNGADTSAKEQIEQLARDRGREDTGEAVSRRNREGDTARDDERPARTERAERPRERDEPPPSRRRLEEPDDDRGASRTRDEPPPRRARDEAELPRRRSRD